MANDLQVNGVTAFIDKAGRKWNLQDYCNMATRATARQAEVAAILTADPEYDLYKIVKIGSTCPVCAPLEGRVYSRSGTNPDYPSLARAFGKIDPAGGDDLSNTYLNIHPNCLHSLVKYTTMKRTRLQWIQEPRSKWKLIRKRCGIGSGCCVIISNIRHTGRPLGKRFPKTLQNSGN